MEKINQSVLNGRTKTIDTHLNERSGGDFVLHVIADMTERSLDIRHGTKVARENKKTTMSAAYFGRLGIREKRRDLSLGQLFAREISRGMRPDYLLENKLVTL